MGVAQFAQVRPDDLGQVIGALKSVAPDAERQPQGPFFEKQLRVATENMGRVDPESLDEYVSFGGFKALATVLGRRDPQWVINEVLKSRLRGRGGGGHRSGAAPYTRSSCP